jgi:hypothetical protein
MPRISAPKNVTTRPADHITVIDKAFAADQDLLAISRRPQFAPQQIVAINETTAFEDIIFRGEDDTADTTYPIPAGGHVIINTPVKILRATSGDNITVACYWWVGSSIDYNK